ncbi:hypothetical protein COR50_05280 [Chitinophaga caeni]|uniref:Uncharacterized protein n=1 Tax=Chitinophaga caeni TaxID=2029983 RepID=A0A291QRX8_9BACT|nr:hypothetical protein [Chitinophaga caeni]ATL46642.1 hypothetical protein COR50_05280 [Chitinophaga caeni]
MSNDQHVDVVVHFIDIDSGETFASSNVPISQLPESFEKQTTLNIGEDEWQVIDANPLLASVFKETQQLTLKLKKIEKLDPRDTLYSIPTISSELPNLAEKAPFPDFTLYLHEDEWRQKEFIHPKKLVIAGEEVDEIKEIWMNESKEIDEDHRAFKRIHVRKLIGTPNLYIPLFELAKLLNAGEPGSVAFQGIEGFVENGFALETGNSKYYGLVENGVVKLLGVVEEGKATMREVGLILKVFPASFVNWSQCLIVPA